MKKPSFEVRLELSGWELFFAELELRDRGAASLAKLRDSVASEVRESMSLERLAQHAPVAALRRLFKNSGCDPTRYRPSSEALLRRLLKGDALPEIHPLVDLNNCLSARLGVPCCVMAEGSFTPPFVFRSGKSDESYPSLRGPFRLEGKPLLLDARGPCDAPITGSERVAVKRDTKRATLVAYLPKDVVRPEDALRALETLLRSAPLVSLLDASAAS